LSLESDKQTALQLKREWHGRKSKASRDKDKNAGSVFEQRAALARLRAHLRDEVHITRAECAGMRTATLRSAHDMRVGTKPPANDTQFAFLQTKKNLLFQAGL